MTHSLTHNIHRHLTVSFFYSNRKRMSVVVRTPDGKLRLYCKGAVSIPPVIECTTVYSHSVCAHNDDETAHVDDVMFVSG